MSYLSKKELIEKIKDCPDDARVCIRAHTPYSGDALYLDATIFVHEDEILGEKIILTSDGLNQTIEADTELIKEEW